MAEQGSSSLTTQQQRAELYKGIWRIANDLRGSVDGWDFKSYVLGMMFYRFISEYLESFVDANEAAAGNPGFSYASLSGAQAEAVRGVLVRQLGFFMLPEQLFSNVRANARQDEDLNETLHWVFTSIEGSAVGHPSEHDFKGLFADIDVNSPKLGPTVKARNEKLVKLLDAVGDMPLGSVADNEIDLFGDAYEFLMKMYASAAGKSGGEFFTPPEVSEVLARIALSGKTRVESIYEAFVPGWIQNGGTVALAA